MLTRQPARLPEQALGAVGAVEQPHRLVEHAAQRHQVLVGRRLGRTALHEGKVDAGGGVAQQGQVLGGPLRVAQFDLDAVPLQALRVALAELAVRALRHAGGHGHALGRRRIQQQVGQRHQADRQQREGRRGGQRQAPRRARWVVLVVLHGHQRLVRSDQISGNSTTSSILRR
jgi:hypothetical protein